MEGEKGVSQSTLAVCVTAAVGAAGIVWAAGPGRRAAAAASFSDEDVARARAEVQDLLLQAGSRGERFRIVRNRVNGELRELLAARARLLAGAAVGSDDELVFRPMVLVLGNHSSGKSTFINHLLGRHVQKTGRAPTDASFTIITHGERAEIGIAHRRGIEPGGNRHRPGGAQGRDERVEIEQPHRREPRAADFIVHVADRRPARDDEIA